MSDRRSRPPKAPRVGQARIAGRASRCLLLADRKTILGQDFPARLSEDDGGADWHRFSEPTRWAAAREMASWSTHMHAQWRWLITASLSALPLFGIAAVPTPALDYPVRPVRIISDSAPGS